MKRDGRLPESELDIMLAVWEAGEKGATAPGILEDKGFLACRKEGRTNRYFPLISRADYEKQESRTVLDKLYAGSLKRFAAALYDGGALSPEDVKELEDYLDTLKKEG